MLVKRARQICLHAAGHYSSPFRLLYGSFGSNPDLLVGRETDIVIEGYPRSGNTFAVVAFREAQRQQNAHIVIGHHLHVPAQLRLAARHSKPLLVLIRDPVSAITSLLVREPHVTPSMAIRSYLSFYRCVRTLRYALVLARFETVIADYGRVIEAVNEKFQTTFSLFDHSEENVSRVFKYIDQIEAPSGRFVNKVARPSTSRQEQMRVIRNEMTIRHSKRLKPCHSLYRDLFAGADV